MSKVIYVHDTTYAGGRPLKFIRNTLVFIILIGTFSIALQNLSQKGKPLLSVSSTLASNESKISVTETEPHQKVTTSYYTGIISGSFFTSALESGLSPNNVNTLVARLSKHFNFVMTPKSNAHFAVEIQQGNPNKIKTFAYYSDDKNFFARQHSNGHFYNEFGNPIDEVLLSYPTKRRFGISSSFCYNRSHPITGRKGPHLGTDYLTPIGTKVITIASGKVLTSRYHPIAGNYVVIEHNKEYVTRYLHLSKRLVVTGEYVQQGQIIALSGNTGRSTGPHLHFELIINGKPVDFERYQEIPNETQPILPEDEKNKFRSDINQVRVAFSKLLKNKSLDR